MINKIRKPFLTSQSESSTWTPISKKAPRDQFFFFFFFPRNHLYLTPRRGKETGKVTVTLQKKRKRKAYLTTLTSQQNYENATSYPTRPLAYPYPYVLGWTKEHMKYLKYPSPFSFSLSLYPPRFMPYISLSFHNLYSLSLSL